jgi:Tol biopolymer transport system component
MLVIDGGESASIHATDVSEPAPFVLDAGAFSLYPVWSPDGSVVAYGSGADYDHTELKVVNAEGSNARSLGVELRGTLAWSPDGTEIAYVRGDELPDGSDVVAIIGADGSNDRVASRWVTVQSVAWSPDGTRLLVTGHPEDGGGIGGLQDFDIYSFATDGSDVVQVTHTRSPDGSSIAFTSDRDATQQEQAAFERGDAFSGLSVFIMRADGSDLRRLLAAGEGEALLPASWKA